MKFKLVTVFLMVSLSPSLAFSIGTSQPACTNFSGDWNGALVTSQGFPFPNQPLEVVQTGCERLLINGANLEIGKVNTLTSESGVKGLQLLRWNENKTVLEYELIGMVNGIIGMSTFHQKGSVKLDGERLVHAMEFVPGTPLLPNVPASVSVTYDRAP
jgi:hypothetical protein